MITNRWTAPGGLWCFVFAFALIVPSLQDLIPTNTEETFEFENQVSVTDLRNPDAKDVGSYTLTGELTVQSLVNAGGLQLLQLTLDRPNVKAGYRNLPLEGVSKHPFYVVLHTGKLVELLVDNQKDVPILNLQRAIASLLVFNYEDKPMPENDVSGECVVRYIEKSPTKFEKIKTECSNWNPNQNPQASDVNIKSTLKVTYELNEKKHLLAVTSKEVHKLELRAKPDAGSQVESILRLTHTHSKPVKSKAFSGFQEAIDNLKNYKPADPAAVLEDSTPLIKEKSLKNLIAAHKKHLVEENIGKESAAYLLAKLLPHFRRASVNELKEVLKSGKATRSQIIDVLGAAQTIDAHNAFFQVYSIENKKNFDHYERYLQALAIGNKPDKAIIEHLLEIVVDEKVTDPKLADTFLQTTAALARHLTFNSGDNLLTKIRHYLVKQLTSNCLDVNCKVVTIRALQNLQDLLTLPHLLEAASTGETKVSVAALQALRSFPIKYFAKGTRSIFESIFFQIKKIYDTTARTIALDILVDMKPNKKELNHLLDYLASNDRNFEIKTYLLQKLQLTSESCPKFASRLKKSLAQKNINNYNVFAQNGLTTIFRRDLSRTPAFNETLLSIQEIHKGVIKRGTVEILSEVENERTSIFKLGIFAGGLSSFVSKNDDNEPEEASPATAGIEISVQGVQLRPLVFFNSQSELMSHVWSGTASEPTPAYVATTLVQDFEHTLVLTSGSTAHLRVLGARSIDLNGQVKLSIWSRNADTEIKKNSGTGITGSLVVKTPFAKLESAFRIGHEPQISVAAHIDFSSQLKFCIRLGKPEALIWYKHVNSINLTNEKPYTKKRTFKVEYKTPGSTLALNQKNNQMCSLVFPE